MRFQEKNPEKEPAVIISMVILLVDLFGIRHNLPAVMWLDLGSAVLAGAGLVREWFGRRSSQAVALYVGAMSLGLLSALLFAVMTEPVHWPVPTIVIMVVLGIILWHSGVSSSIQAIGEEKPECPYRGIVHRQEIDEMWDPINKKETFLEFAKQFAFVVCLFALFLIFRTI